MKSEGKPICYLCGLQSDYLPSKSGLDLIGISCIRCGDYYLDGLLEKCGVTKEETDKKILSGYTRWEKELGHVAPELAADRIDMIIRENNHYSDVMKTDKLLMYYLKKNPNRGSNVEFVSDVDYPITFSKNSSEFVYLLEKVADETLEYINNLSITSGGPPEGYFQITPKGWERIDWLNKIKLTDDKYKLEKQEMLSFLTKDEMQMKEQANIKGNRWSSGLARRLGNLYLQSSLALLAKGLQIDKEIMFEGKASLDAQELEILCTRANKLADFEKAFLNTKLSEIYRDCHAYEGYFKTDIINVFSEIDKKHESILIDLEVAKFSKQKPKYPKLPEKDLGELIKMDESTTLEFKSTFQWDVNQARENKELRKEVINTIAAFNNTEGGYLIIGISDDKSIFGLERDYDLFKSPNKRDALLQTITNVIEDKIDRVFATKTEIMFYNLMDKDICRIKVNFGDGPVWVKENRDIEAFYIRVQSSERRLSPSKTMSYIRAKWK